MPQSNKILFFHTTTFPPMYINHLAPDIILCVTLQIAEDF